MAALKDELADLPDSDCEEEVSYYAI